MSATESKSRARRELSPRELWCAGCGYGVVIRHDPPECPICRRANWRERPSSARCN